MRLCKLGSCLGKLGLRLDGQALDKHIGHHEDRATHFPFTEAQYKRVMELGEQAGTPGFLANLLARFPVMRSHADVDKYIEAHAAIAAESA